MASPRQLEEDSRRALVSELEGRGWSVVSEPLSSALRADVVLKSPDDRIWIVELKTSPVAKWVDFSAVAQARAIADALQRESPNATVATIVGTSLEIPDALRSLSRELDVWMVTSKEGPRALAAAMAGLMGSTAQASSAVSDQIENKTAELERRDPVSRFEGEGTWGAPNWERPRRQRSAGITRGITINAPVEKIFAYLADISKHGEWGNPSQKLHVEKTSAGPVEQGSTFKSVSYQFGRQDDTLTIVEYVPNRRVVYESEGRLGHIRESFEITPSGGGAEVQKGFEVIKAGFPFVIFAPIVKAFIAPSALKGDLERIKAKVEAS